MQEHKALKLTCGLEPLDSLTVYNVSAEGMHFLPTIRYAQTVFLDRESLLLLQDRIAAFLKVTG